MSNEEASDLVKWTFDKILMASDINDLEKIRDSEPILKNIPNPNKYPKLEIQIGSDEIDQLRRKGIIKENAIEPLTQKNSTLEKLLYAILWKNGDLGKEKHIIEGIISENDNQPPSSSIVFYQFGRKLSDQQEPIIDQHTLRAFIIYNAGDREVKSIREKSTINKDDWGNVKSYKIWLSKNLPSSVNSPEALFVVDQIIFGLGKAVKLKK